jgi:hypothetical protein
VRAASLPTALPVAAAVVLVAAVLAPLAVPSTALAERWLRPVPGEVARPFSYSTAAPFVRGAHRGADLAARPGAAVRSACTGRVVHAGAVAGRDRVVSVRCGNRRVSYLPLASVAARAGAPVRAGAPIGTVATGHGGLHVGVRDEGDPFGYVDPMGLLPASERPLAPAPRPGARPFTRVPRPGARPFRRAPRPAVRPLRRVSRPGARPLRPVPGPAARPLRRVPRPAARPFAPTPRRVAWPSTSPHPLAGRAPSSLAPWPVWLGLSVLLTGAAGSGTIAVRRRIHRGRASAAPAGAATCR